jgi:hypothetical protein
MRTARPSPITLTVELYLTSAELAAAAGIRRATLTRLVRLGLVEPTAAGGDRYPAAAAVRVRRMLRLQGHLGVNLTGAAIIVDLLERLERLEADSRRLRATR